MTCKSEQSFVRGSQRGLFVLAAPHSLRDLSSPTRDQTQAPCSGRRSKHWIQPGNSSMFPKLDRLYQKIVPRIAH